MLQGSRRCRNRTYSGGLPERLMKPTPTIPAMYVFNVPPDDPEHASLSGPFLVGVRVLEFTRFPLDLLRSLATDSHSTLVWHELDGCLIYPKIPGLVNGVLCH